VSEQQTVPAYDDSGEEEAARELYADTSEPPRRSLFAQRARNRAAESARDAAECILAGRDADARSLLSEAGNELDRAIEREKT
jgi:hypothetical protein